ncbi:MAG: hypothetical protein R3A45_00645 [Bdellovibrionota bacterium]
MNTRKNTTLLLILIVWMFTGAAQVEAQSHLELNSHPSIKLSKRFTQGYTHQDVYRFSGLYPYYTEKFFSQSLSTVFVHPSGPFQIVVDALVPKHIDWDQDNMIDFDPSQTPSFYQYQSLILINAMTGYDWTLQLTPNCQPGNGGHAAVYIPVNTTFTANKIYNAFHITTSTIQNTKFKDTLQYHQNKKVSIGVVDEGGKEQKYNLSYDVSEALLQQLFAERIEKIALGAGREFITYNNKDPWASEPLAMVYWGVVGADDQSLKKQLVNDYHAIYATPLERYKNRHQNSNSKKQPAPAEKPGDTESATTSLKQTTKAVKVIKLQNLSQISGTCELFDSLYSTILSDTQDNG